MGPARSDGGISDDPLTPPPAGHDESDEDAEGPSEADHWKGPAPSVEEKSR